MEAREILKNVDEIRLIKRRFELITVARYRDKNKIMKAAKAIDKIREKTKGKGISMMKIVRKWRDERYGHSSS